MNVVFFVFLSSLLLFPESSLAQGGLVQCGNPGQNPCTFCDIWSLLDRVVKLLIEIAFVAGAIGIVVGGFFIMTAGGSENNVTKGRGIITTAVIGIVIVLVTWVVLNTIFQFFAKGVGGWDPRFWNTIQCSVSPAPAPAGPAPSAPQSSQAPAQIPTAMQASSLNILSLTPSTAFIGDTITITGRGFTPADNTLNFLTPTGYAISVPALASPDGTSISFTVPSRYHDSDIVDGTYRVSVTNSNGTSNEFSFSVRRRFASGDRIVTTGVLAVRVEPSLDSPQAALLPQGTTGTVVGGPVTADGNAWWRIRYDTNTVGWSSQVGLRAAPSPSRSHVRYFGYYLADPRNAAEVAPFSNVAALLASRPTENIVPMLSAFEQHGLQAVLVVDGLLFETTPIPNCAIDPFSDRRCATTSLRANYEDAWNTFVRTNRLAERASSLAAIWIKDEPAWNNLPPAELELAAALVKRSLPGVPTLAIEGWPSMSRFEMPRSIDWVGFDAYGFRNPDTNPYYRGLWTIMKERKLPHQKIFVVLDGAWRSGLQGSTSDPRPGAGGLLPEDMGEVAKNYYALALSDPDVIGIGVWLWESGVVTADQRGSRDLPAALAEHRRIGGLITGKTPPSSSASPDLAHESLPSFELPRSPQEFLATLSSLAL